MNLEIWLVKRSPFIHTANSLWLYLRYNGMTVIILNVVDTISNWYIFLQNKHIWPLEQHFKDVFLTASLFSGAKVFIRVFMEWCWGSCLLQLQSGQLLHQQRMGFPAGLNRFGSIGSSIGWWGTMLDVSINYTVRKVLLNLFTRLI